MHAAIEGIYKENIMQRIGASFVIPEILKLGAKNKMAVKCDAGIYSCKR